MSKCGSEQAAVEEREDQLQWERRRKQFYGNRLKQIMRILLRYQGNMNFIMYN